MSQETKKSNSVVTPEFRVSFAHVFEKHSAFKDQEPKYELTMLFPKKTDLSPLKKLVQSAVISKWGADKTKWPKNLKLPFRDGDEKDLEGYAGNIFVRASSKTKPGIVNQNLQEIISQEEFYAGCYARAQIGIFTYDKVGNKGVAFGLQNLQKLRDGQAFSGRQKAEDVFEVAEDASEDASNYSQNANDDDMFN